MCCFLHASDVESFRTRGYFITVGDIKRTWYEQLLFADEQPQATGCVEAVERNVDKFLVEYLEHFFMYSQEAT